ncbi:jg26315 [Pararge aegeria aegeria]|uniref:Jg26315 protein n=1 Tax=Pararge aegeria aegeria TaxID=348720 RepID=A0A8S4RAB0_9NEOP|nr:jg26315 [Pararge aegeria aegeria]
MPVREKRYHEFPMDSDSVLEALVEPWKATAAVSKRLTSWGRKTVAVEPEPVLVAKTKAKAKTGRGAYLGHSVAKARLKEMNMCTFETEAAADNTYRLYPLQTRSKTWSQDRKRKSSHTSS